MKGSLVVHSLHAHELPQSKTAAERTWQAFMRIGTNHSARACTLAGIINRCEREGVPYVLQAHPGMGYFIKKGITL